MRLMFSWPTALVLFAALQLGGCQGDEPALDGTQWKLVSWSISSAKATDFDITLQFADGRIGGRSAVNSYTGAYTRGPGNAFTVGELAGTRMAGPEPEMRAEQGYLALLAQARSYKAAPDQLTLLDAGGNDLLVYVPGQASQ